MASLGHIAVGLFGARLQADRLQRHGTAVRRRTRVWLSLGAITLSMLPDLDVIAFRLGIPYAAPFGHRGASHSLAAALVAGALCAAWASLRRPAGAAAAAWPGPPGVFAWCGALVASHPLLDACTDGGLGVALLWPFSNARFFAPDWLRLLPVAPIGQRLFSPRGLHVLAVELLLFAPLWLWAARPGHGQRHG